MFFTALCAAELILPSHSLDRHSMVPVTFRMNGQVSGKGTFHLRWTDALGRTVEDRHANVELTDEDEFTFSLDLRRAVAMQNTLDVRLQIQGKNLKGEDNRDETAKAVFIARPGNSRWSDYEITMWQQYPQHLLPALRELGISNGQYSGRSETAPASFVGEDMRWYAENIGTDFYAEYHRFRRDRVPHWAFLQVKEMLRKNPQDKNAFKRNPSLSDPVWRETIRERLVKAAQRFKPYRPLFYSLADESGIADLAAFWDFDFSDMSLVPMRRWLRSRYGSLAALNAEWGSTFANWDAVTPPTTHEAMERPGENFAAWADFKEWMDISFSDALLMGRKAVETVDPEAFVSIGGGQRPGWGGYDYARITKALTAIEPYDIGNNVEIIRSLNPEMVMVSTGFANGPWEQQRVWRELFHGQRGLIIWDEKFEYVGKDGEPGERGSAAAKYYNEIRYGVGALIINSQPLNEPIAIHYSQASMRTEWM
ncbi:MAG: beta-galactosidase, partial [Acidobacteria bacterium]|nr:beta-galactosidase [Acidobacteriota bacterium]